MEPAPKQLRPRTVTLTPVTITVAPTAATLFVGQSKQFAATVNSATDTTVLWSVTPSTGAGSITSTGLYTAPASIASQQMATITATSNADPSKSATATVTLLVPGGARRGA